MSPLILGKGMSGNYYSQDPHGKVERKSEAHITSPLWCDIWYAVVDIYGVIIIHEEGAMGTQGA